MVYLLRSVDFAELGRQLRATQWGWAAIATALAPAGIWARAVRWRYLFPPRSEPPGLVAATMIGYMANNVLPLRAGEFVRVYVVARRWGAAAAGAAGRGHGFWTTLATLFVERVLDSLFIVAMLAALVLVIPVPAVLQYAAAVLLAVDCLGIAIMVGLVVAPVSRPGHTAGAVADVELTGDGRRFVERFLRPLREICAGKSGPHPVDEWDGSAAAAAFRILVDERRTTRRDVAPPTRGLSVRA